MHGDMICTDLLLVFATRDRVLSSLLFRPTMALIGPFVVTRCRELVVLNRPLMRLLVVPTAILSCLGAVYLLWYLLIGFGYRAYSVPQYWLVVSAIAFIVSGCAFLFRRSLTTVQSLPYVPPAAEQLERLAALPAEDILVRGSDRPAAAPDELLRAAHAGTPEPHEQLLRPDSSDTE